MVGVSSRGHTSGRGSLGVRGGARRGRFRTGGTVSFVNRAEMLEEHRRIVSKICESDAMEIEGQKEGELISPTLTDGNFTNLFYYGTLYEFILYLCLW